MKNTLVVVAAAAIIGFGAAHVFAADAYEQQYENAIKEAKTRYDSALAKCDRLDGNQADVCEQRAEANYTKEKASAEARRDSAEAGQEATNKSAEADYEVAKEKCDALDGTSKDFCLDQAKERYGR
jgi:hypothetical protein